LVENKVATFHLILTTKRKWSRDQEEIGARKIKKSVPVTAGEEEHLEIK
jgi:hypothetical protein